MVKITDVFPTSYADKCGIKKDDILISVNGNEINDVLDYRFYLTERKITVECMRGVSRLTFSISKGEYDDIGLDFETPLMDKKHTCKNGCIFCFIDQNPKGLRESLYFKDDDSRLSFLHGNYITLTNMTDADVERIVKMKFSPINISVHTTNPELRVKMMKNKRSGEVLRYLDDFYNAGLDMCAQIVLCKGVNDGEELVRSLSDLSKYSPRLTSVAVVPAGLTAYREKLYPLADFTKDEAKKVIEIIDSFGENHKKNHGTRLVYAADEFYLKAGIDIPGEEYYEGYPQLENGVGMLRSFAEEFKIAVGDVTQLIDSLPAERTVSIVTGVASYPMLCGIARKIESLTDKIHINVYKIVNHFFGESITVSGLLTGKDMFEQLNFCELGDEVLIPKNSLKHGEDVFLCGMTLAELSDALKTPIRVVENDGFDIVDAVFGVENC